MRVSRSARNVAVAVMGAAVMVVAACRRGSTESPEKNGEAKPSAAEERREDVVELSPEAIQAASIESTPAALRRFGGEIRATAVVKPNQNRLAHVAPRISGRIVEVKALLGDIVEQGQTLARLDSLELGEKKSAFLQARTSLEVARRNYEREKRLFGKQISSEKEYVEAKGEFERSEALYHATREALRLVGIPDEEIEKITWGGKREPLSRFPLVAPFPGTVVEQHATLGELSRPEDTLYTIADLTTLWIVIDVFEKQFAHVAIGQKAAVTIKAYPGERFTGTITYLGQFLDEKTRATQARVEVENRDGRLRPGMFATASIATAPAEGPETIAVPSEAIQRIHGKPVAFVEEKPGRYAIRQLAVGEDSGADVQVVSGLAAGERVVTRGGFYLKSTLLKGEIVGDAD
jgi:membrane fusion protein, heavy metal efflux system